MTESARRTLRSASLREKSFQDELNAIRLRSRYIWSKPDRSETTNAFFFDQPDQDERTFSRPTSASRRNNPHPKLVFMRTGMKEIPNAYGAPALTVRPETVHERATTPSYYSKLKNLSPIERQGVEAFLKSANEDSKERVVDALEQFRRTMNNDFDCPNVGPNLMENADGRKIEIYPSIERYRQATGNEKEIRAIEQVLSNPTAEVSVPETKPTNVRLTSRQSSRSKNHFQRRSHSHYQCPWPLAHRPYRGDYSIHMDWHPRLPHHRLTCLC